MNSKMVFLFTVGLYLVVPLPMWAMEHDVKFVLEHGGGLICAAAREGNIDEIKRLIQLGVKCYEEDENGWTPVFYAAYNGHLDLLKYLIKECGADPHAVNRLWGWNLVHIAVKEGELDILKYLIKLGVKCNEKDKDGLAPVFYAAANGYLESLKYLIDECGTDPHVVDMDGHNLVHTAVRKRDLDLFKYLIEECNGDPHALESENPNILMRWPEVVPTILYDYGLYTKPNLKRLLTSKSNEKMEKLKPQLKKLLETKEFARGKIGSTARRFVKSLNASSEFVWHLSEVVPAPVAAKVLTYLGVPEKMKK